MSATHHEIWIADGTAALFRAYFGMRSVRAPDGTEVGGVLGFAQWLAKWVTSQMPTHVALVFDAGASTFRNSMYPEYKANRGAPPEDLIPQFDLAQALAHELGFVCFCEPGFEADDLMATLAAKIRASGQRGVLVTPDKDVLQLIDDTISVAEPKAWGRLGHAEVMQRFGVSPAQMVDFQALCGDSTDNIPGVPGIGPKSAAQLIAQFTSLEGIYAALDEVAASSIRGAKSLAKKLESHRDAALLSRELVRLKADVPLRAAPQSLAGLRYRGPRPEADALFDRLGFHAPLRRLRSFVGE